MVIKRSNLFIAFLSFILVLSAALFGLTGGFYTAHAADFTVTGFSYSSVYNSELYLFQIDVSCTLTKNDLDNFNVADVTDYVEINGKSVTEWNSDYIDVARSDWAFPDLSPWNETGFYNHRPIVLRSTKNSVRLFLHRNLYSAIVTAFGKMTVQIKSGMSAQGNTLSADSAKYKVIETAGVPSGAEVMPDGPEITEFDITAQTFIRNFDVENELKKVYVDCGAGVSMPKIDFHAIDSDDYKYIADYIAINGNTVTGINTEYAETAAGWTFTKFPSTAADKYKLPIILYIPENQNYIELRIHENYYDALEGNMTVAVLAGLTVLNDNTEYTISEDLNYTYISGKWIKDWQPTDITAQTFIRNFDVENELKKVYVDCGAGVSMPKIDFHAIDSDDYKYIADYIAINGKTITEINATTDTTGWTFTKFPSTAADKYKLPIILYIPENQNYIELRIHENYYDALEGNMTVAVLAGLTVLNDNTEYTISEDLNYTYISGKWIKDWQPTDITAQTFIRNFDVENELKKVYVDFGAGVSMPKIDFHAIDSDSYKYIADYIAINGKAISEINATTDTTGWTFTKFPSTASAVYKLPIILYIPENQNYIELRIHENYYDVLEDDLTVSVLQGLSIQNGEVEYVISEDVVYTRKHGSWGNSWQIVDITDNVQISGFIHQSAELRVFRVNLGAGILPDGISYGIIDNNDYKYIADYIAINGKTINEINATTDTTGWTFSVFPSSANEKYRVPIMVFVNGDNIEIKIHDEYYRTFDGDFDFTVLAGLEIYKGETVYTASEDVNFTFAPIDVAESVKVDGFTAINGIKAVSIRFDSGILPNGIDYGVHDDAYSYIANYIAINGKTINEINATVDTTGWTFEMFPSNADDRYKLPIIVFIKDDKIELRIHDNYYASIEGDLEIAVLAGFDVVNGDAIYAVSEDVAYTRKHGSWGKDWKTVDITEQIQVGSWIHQNDELRVFYVEFGADVIPQGIGYGIMDNEDYTYIADYITINGKTINKINATVDTTGWTFTVFPSSADEKYRVPVMVFVNNGKLEIKIHDNYYETLKGNLVLSVKKGLIIVCGETENVVEKTKTYKCKQGVWGTTWKYVVADNVKVSGWIHQNNELRVFYLSFGEGVLPEGISYGIIDNNDYKNIADYIAINGKTITEINATTDTTGWTFTVFPSSANEKYRVPIMVFVNGDNIEIKIHDNYYGTIEGDLEITVLSGFEIVNEAIVYKTSKDAVYTRIHGSWGKDWKIVDIKDDVKVSGWIHQNNELRVFYLDLGENVLPDGISYGIIDNKDYNYIADYIAINGKTIAEINAATDTTGWTFSVFPSSADEKYRVPIMVFVNGDNIEIKIHDNYYATIEDDLEISVLSRLEIYKGETINVVTEDVAYTRKHGSWGKNWQIVDIKDNVKISGFIHQSAELRVFRVNLGAGILPDGISYGIIDNNDYKYIADYIAINGKTINEINATTDTTGWTFTVFPSTADAKYRVPVMVFVNGDNIEIKIHDEYYRTFDGDFDFTVLAGLEIYKGEIIYTVSEDVNFTFAPIDVTESVKVDGFTAINGIKAMNIRFNSGILPNGIDYGVHDDAYSYIANYIAINGKTIAEINATTDITGWTFGMFPSNADDRYKLPIIVFIKDDKIELRIHDNYYLALDGDLEIVVSDGFDIVNGDAIYAVSEDVAYTRKHGSWGKDWNTVDITENVKVSGWVHQDSELRVFYLNLGEGVLPAGISYGIIDNNDYKYIADYIAINGKTITEINATTDTTGWTFSVFPSSANEMYRLPIIIFVNGGKLEIKIHDNYYEMIEGDLEITVLSGLIIVNGDTINTVSEDVAYTRKHGSWGKDWKTVDITENVKVSGWVHQDSELRVFYLNLGEGVLPAGISYGIIDNNDYKYIADYIAINGKTITEINATTDTTGWTFSVFPSSANEIYRLPIIIFVNGGKLEIKIHDNYYEMIEGDLEITVLSGLIIMNGDTINTVREDVAYTRKHGIWGNDWQTADVAGNVTVKDWIEINGVKVFRITFGDGVLPKGIDYGVHDSEYGYIAEYITINGKTVKEINESIDATGWDFKMFPSTADDKYKLPVIIHVNTERIEVRVHDWYYASVAGKMDVSVLEGLVLVSGNTEYVVSKTADYIRRSGQWLDLSYEYSVNYYVNSELYATERYTINDTITMLAAPETAVGYEFSGWDKKITKINEGDEDVYGYVTAIVYTIEYNADGGINSSVNPLKYTIESETIILQASEKKGYVFAGWYDNDGNLVKEIKAGSHGNIVLNAKYVQVSDGCFSGISVGIYGYLMLLLCAVAVFNFRLFRKSANK